MNTKMNTKCLARFLGGSKRCGFSNGRARVYPADADEDDG